MPVAAPLKSVPERSDPPPGIDRPPPPAAAMVVHRPSRSALPLYIIAGVAIGVVLTTILLNTGGAPAPSVPITPLNTYLEVLRGDTLQLPLIVAGAALCLIGVLLSLPPAHLNRLKRFNLWPLWPTAVVCGVGYVVGGTPLSMEIVTTALVMSVLLPVLIAPMTILSSALAAPAVLAGYVTAVGLAHTPPSLALVAGATGLLATAITFRVRRARATGPPPVDAPHVISAVDVDGSDNVTTAVLAAADGFIAALSPSDVADRIAEDTNVHLHAAGTILLLWDETLEGYRVGAIGGRHALSGAELRQVEVPPDCVPNLRGAPNGHVLEVDPGTLREPMLGSLLRRWKAETLLGVRLQWGDRLLGLLFVARTPHARPFSARDYDVLIGIARHAAAGLAHVNLIADLQSANQLKEEFMATMSHELRTPLNVIIGYTDLQMDGAFGDLNPDHLDTLGRVREQSIQLLDLIQATLDTSRLERGLVTVELTEVAVPTLVESLKAQIPPSWRKPTVELNWRIPSGLPSIRTDPNKLQIILRNLIHNALKFTNHGVVTVAALRHPTKDQLSFVVQDSGVGIKAEHLSQIFDMFRQAPNGDGNHGGVGLGLYIVKRLAGILGAEIDVSSAPERGATFRIHVPIGGPLPIPTQH